MHYIKEIIILLFAYMWPGYQILKVLEKKKAESEIKKWSRYFLVLILLNTFEVLTSHILHQFNYYHVLKFLFILYLWHPRTEGAEFIYNSIIKPNFLKREKRINENVDKYLEMIDKQCCQLINTAKSMILEIIENNDNNTGNRRENKRNKRQRQREVNTSNSAVSN